jgi:hypothetical protein
MNNQYLGHRFAHLVERIRELTVSYTLHVRKRGNKDFSILRKPFFFFRGEGVVDSQYRTDTISVTGKRHRGAKKKTDDIDNENERQTYASKPCLLPVFSIAKNV